MARKQDTAVRQEQIAVAALWLIGQRGLHGLSVADVAARIGLVPSAVYRHFDSKEEVVDAALDLVRERFMDNVRAVATEETGALARLRRLLERHTELIMTNQAAIMRVVFSEEVFAGKSTRRARVFRTVTAYLKAVAAIVREGQDRGEIRAEVDPDVAALMFLGLIQPTAILWFMSGGSIDVRSQTRSAWALFERALVP